MAMREIFSNESVLLFLTFSGRNGASSRYRVYQYLPYFERAGYTFEVMPPAEKGRGASRLISAFKEENRIIAAAGRADIVFIQKRLLPVGLIAKLKRLGKKIVFDFDDSIFTSPRGDWSVTTRRKVEARLKAVIKASDVVINGNGFLRGYSEISGAGRVAVIPTAIDTSRYSPKVHGNSPVTLGWVGSSVNHAYIDLLGGALPRLSREVPGLKLLVVSDKDYVMEGVVVENRRWSEETEAKDIMDMDIGLMPLADDVWTCGKCALKALQYMACGVPAVCSPVGANMEVIEDGVDGFLPGDDEGWLEALRKLASSPSLRARMGSAGRLKLEEKYSVTGLWPGYLEVMRSLWD